MKPLRRYAFNAFAIAAVSAMAACSSPDSSSSLFTDVKSDPATVKTDPSVSGAVKAKLNREQFRKDNSEIIRLPIPGGDTITLVRRRLQEDGRIVAWYGEVEEVPGSFAFFLSTGKAISGGVNVKGRRYRVQLTDKNIYRITELNPDAFFEADDDGEVPPFRKPTHSPGDDDGCPDAASDIDLMVVYTEAARIGAGGEAAMEALIYESVYLTNLSYENSNVTQRVRLVHFAEVDYAEAGDSVIDRARLREPADGFMDNVHPLRDAHGADMVMLMTETSEGGNCGRAYIMDPVSANQEDYAFGVVRQACAAGNMSMPHELGHIMSARHQNDATNTPYAYGHGFFQLTPADASGQAWETIMSKRGDADRKLYFSNPGVQYSPTGDPATDAMGTAASNDNARVLDNTAATVANFRCSSPAVNNVWMKDTWQDTGLEPDPATAGQAMYRSPYIWIRNDQDAGATHQHEHEDPRFGSTNWVYTKMHNGSASSQSGELELYTADASLSLTWPGSWTLLASVPTTINGSSTGIVEQAWANVPDPAVSSHYCMLARWVSPTDPMATVEGPVISANVRANNNLVWRNLNIVDLDDDEDSTVSMLLEGTEKKKVLTRLALEDLTKFPKPAFLKTGKILLTVDKTLIRIWEQGGKKSSGLERLGPETFGLYGERGSLENLTIPYGYKGKVQVRFIRSDETPASTFDIGVRNYQQREKEYELVGGVDYELRSK